MSPTAVILSTNDTYVMIIFTFCIFIGVEICSRRHGGNSDGGKSGAIYNA